MSSKKKIIGKSKLASVQVEQETEKPALDLISHKPESKMKSFRLFDSDIEKLRTITKEVNQFSTTRVISETSVIKGLIELGAKTSPEKILKSIKDAF
jgi:hypothetical protein